MTLNRLLTCCAAALLLTGCDHDLGTAPETALTPSFSVNDNQLLATGSGHVPFASGLREFTFHAKGDGEGGATGSYKIDLTALGLFFEVEVTCMAIEGNTAWVAGHISDTNAGAIEIGSVSYFYAIDNGEGSGSPKDVVSTARINDVQGEDQLFCAERPLLLPAFEIEQGNVQVR